MSSPLALRKRLGRYGVAYESLVSSCKYTRLALQGLGGRSGLPQAGSSLRVVSGSSPGIDGIHTGIPSMAGTYRTTTCSASGPSRSCFFQRRLMRQWGPFVLLRWAASCALLWCAYRDWFGHRGSEGLHTSCGRRPVDRRSPPLPHADRIFIIGFPSWDLCNCDHHGPPCSKPGLNSTSHGLFLSAANLAHYVSGAPSAAL
ncbi:hypothetical protein QF050_001028 [Arthrobacter sp. SLBN-112]|nr:hypothetical protein [Arthrobacter sp. SLBN-112]